MSAETYEDDCPGCLPAIVDLETSTPLADDHPAVLAMMAIWDKTTISQRQAFHRVTCNNSRDNKDLAVIQHLSAKLQQAMAQPE